MLGRNRLSGRGIAAGGAAAREDVDPMSYLGNLADAMLVMSVGLMLALISAWQLDLSDIRADIQVADEAEELDIETDSDDPTLEDYGLSEYGKVFVDEDGNYYMVETAGQEGEGA